MTDLTASTRRAKIVCTIGPASRDPEMLRQMLRAGMDVARINFSHTGQDEARQVIDLARSIAHEEGRPLAILTDLQGPKIRVGDLPEPLQLVEGQRYTIVTQAQEAGAVDLQGPPRIPTTYKALWGDVTAGDRILLDDGHLELRVEAVAEGAVEVAALNGGLLHSQKGINLPGVDVQAPSMTEADLANAEFSAGLDVDYLALSFVRRPSDVSDLRKVAGDGPLLIAKVEKDQAVRSLPEIMGAADGVMVARGDLGVEMPYEEVPIVQKRTLRLGRELIRISITATQMLESMTRSPRPTRAEVSDVANALLDGTDAVMLSAETATGEYPVEAVATMDRVIRRIEREKSFVFDASDMVPSRGFAAVQHTPSAAIAAASVEALTRLGCRFMVTFTRSGFTARVVAAQRPPVPILAVTDQERTYRQLALVWGVVPILVQGDEINYDTLLSGACDYALEAGLGDSGERFIVTAGVPFHVAGTTNMMKIEVLP
ncbi:MAG: pyruvate kinase [Gemmatimonadota bacterium]